MRRLGPGALVCALLTVAVSTALATEITGRREGPPEPAPGGEVFFTTPGDGAVVGGQPWVKTSGRARLPAGRAPAAFDVMVVIDTSGSTGTPAALANSAAGSMWPPGLPAILGGGPSILDAEVTAALQFLSVSDPKTTRVGVITFAGPTSMLSDTRRPNAHLEQPLTFDYDAVRATLARVKRRGPSGGTDIAAGVRLAVRELRAVDGAQSGRRPDARKVALLMTDGFPTLPIPSNTPDARNVEIALNAVRIAAKARIVIHAFCLGPEALFAPIACREAARITGGGYHPVEKPGDIVELLPATPVGNVELIRVRNATTGQAARAVTVTPDGDFTAELPVAPGENRLIVEVHGGDGPPATAAVVVHYRGSDVTIEVERERTVDIQVERPPSSGNASPRLDHRRTNP
jgi:Mg-chelatase subunit ChlD